MPVHIRTTRTSNTSNLKTELLIISVILNSPLFVCLNGYLKFIICFAEVSLETIVRGDQKTEI